MAFPAWMAMPATALARLLRPTLRLFTLVGEQGPLRESAARAEERYGDWWVKGFA